MRQTVIAMAVVGAVLGLSAGAVSGQAGCPAGYVVQEVNFAAKTVACASLSTKQIVSLEAKVAALQAKVAALQAQLASLLTSPSGQYSITVRDTGIELAGPGVSLQLRDSGTAGTPVPTVEVTTTKLELTAAADTLLTSGRHYLVTTGMDMSMVTGGDASLATGGNTVIDTSGATSIATGTSAQLLAGSTTTIQSAAATTIQGGPGAAPSSIQVDGSVSISSINDIDIEAPGDTTIRSTGGLDIFTSAHHIHY